MNKITWTEFKKLDKDEIIKKVPLEVTYDFEPVFRVVPLTWKDPRFVMSMGLGIGKQMAEAK